MRRVLVAAAVMMMLTVFAPTPATGQSLMLEGGFNPNPSGDGGPTFDQFTLDVDAPFLPHVFIAGQMSFDTDDGQDFEPDFSGLGPRLRHNLDFATMYGHYLFGVSRSSESRRIGAGLDFGVTDRVMARFGIDWEHGMEQADGDDLRFMFGLGCRWGR